MGSVRCCKIVVTSFRGDRKKRKKTTTGGKNWVPKCYAWHAQNFTMRPHIMGLMGLNLGLDKCVDSGVPMDTFYVLNGNGTYGYEAANDFLLPCDGKPSASGNLYVTVRESNAGWAYGAYSDMFAELRNEYDYFIFTEDDVLFT